MIISQDSCLNKAGQAQIKYVGMTKLASARNLVDVSFILTVARQRGARTPRTCVLQPALVSSLSGKQWLCEHLSLTEFLDHSKCGRDRRRLCDTSSLDSFNKGRYSAKQECTKRALSLSSCTWLRGSTQSHRALSAQFPILQTIRTHSRGLHCPLVLPLPLWEEVVLVHLLHKAKIVSFGPAAICRAVS